MPLDAFLLEILVCPETREKVAPADDELLQQLNAAIDKGSLRNRNGDAVAQKVDGALVRSDGALAYVVRDDIPVMLTGEAIPLDQLEG